MKIALITPASSSSINGNSVTAARYSRILRRLGHRVARQEEYDGENADAMVALHAGKSHDSILRFSQTHPSAPLIVVLTGTDLYRDLHNSPQIRESLRLSTRLVVLQKMALDELAERERKKTTVIYQSFEPYSGQVERPRSYFRVAVVANLREEKDPLLAAAAARLLPESSRIRIVHIGKALSPKFTCAARDEMRSNPRYRWLGETSHGRARRLIAASHLVAITSKIEGSSNVLGEALASGTPVLASRIPGLTGTLGRRYPGYFEPGDAETLSILMYKTESGRGFYDRLQAACAQLSGLIDPEVELRAWKRLLEETRSSNFSNLPEGPAALDHRMLA